MDLDEEPEDPLFLTDSECDSNDKSTDTITVDGPK